MRIHADSRRAIASHLLSVTVSAAPSAFLVVMHAMATIRQGHVVLALRGVGRLGGVSANVRHRE